MYLPLTGLKRSLAYAAGATLLRGGRSQIVPAAATGRARDREARLGAAGIGTVIGGAARGQRSSLVHPSAVVRREASRAVTLRTLPGAVAERTVNQTATVWVFISAIAITQRTKAGPVTRATRLGPLPLSAGVVALIAEAVATNVPAGLAGQVRARPRPPVVR